MNKIYETTKQIHKTIEKINKKFKLDLKHFSDTVIYLNDGFLEETMVGYCENYISDTGELMTLRSRMNIATTITNDWQFAIGSPRIKKILVELKDVLGENPNIKRSRNGFYGAYHNPDGLFFAEIVHDDEGCVDELNFASYARDLCYRWLDSLNPMFDKEPEKVLEELLEILEKLIKK